MTKNKYFKLIIATVVSAFIFLICSAFNADYNDSKAKSKKLSLNSPKPNPKFISTTNEITIIEGLPFVLKTDLFGKTFSWQKDGYLLKSETNNFFVMDFAVEGDAGQYTLHSENKVVVFNVSFKRTIKILINDQEIENFNDSNGRVEALENSIITLIPFVEGLPIRYTLDGSEPTGKSALYTGPITIRKKIYLRAKIEIPETDSTRIKVLYEAF
jgi:hypothetical protein